MICKLDAGGFWLELEINESDLNVFHETEDVRVSVECCGFSGKAVFGCETGSMVCFAKRLYEIYLSLEGKAVLDEDWGQSSFISIEGNGRGHFMIKGRLISYHARGEKLQFEFEHETDQSYLKEFCCELRGIL